MTTGSYPLLKGVRGGEEGEWEAEDCWHKQFSHYVMIQLNSVPERFLCSQARLDAPPAIAPPSPAADVHKEICKSQIYGFLRCYTLYIHGTHIKRGFSAQIKFCYFYLMKN